jgi:malate dehydrogenase
VMLEGEYGIDGVSLSVPVWLAAGGVREIEQWPLSKTEQEGLRVAGRIVGDAAAGLA